MQHLQQRGDPYQPCMQLQFYLYQQQFEMCNTCE